MIKVNDLKKNYGQKTAVNGISFTVDDNEVLGLLGPNGAGKSTIMNIISGFIPASSGTVSVCGIDVAERPTEAKRKIGYLPEQPPIYPEMTVREYLSFVAELKGVKDIKAGVGAAAKKTGVSNVMDRRTGNLSKGYKQRTGFAAALIGDPEVLILDEPTVGLDPNQIIEIRKLIKELGKKHSVILSSHILGEINAVCDRIIIVNNGMLAADTVPERDAARLEELFVKLTGGNNDEGDL